MWQGRLRFLPVCKHRVGGADRQEQPCRSTACQCQPWALALLSWLKRCVPHWTQCRPAPARPLPRLCLQVIGQGKAAACNQSVGHSERGRKRCTAPAPGPGGYPGREVRGEWATLVTAGATQEATHRTLVVQTPC